MVFKRNLSLPTHSFFLFGPRGTGKTTWLKSVLPGALWFDLLDTKTYLSLNRDPSLLEKRVEAQPRGMWVVIDEVQKLPHLMDMVQKLMGRFPNRFRFALSGSSARKLKRLGTNLLAGRAVNRSFFPLTSSEVGFKPSVLNLIDRGNLPSVRSNMEFAQDILDAYVENYLKEEIQQEALTKDLGSFSRFLEVAAICNGQTVNVSNIARDAGVARPTVQRYFDVLVQTLIGLWVPPWKKRAKIKEVGHPKFYFFDPGVVRSILGLLHDPVEKSEKGSLLETLVLHELRAWQNISRCGGQFYYWGTPSGSEVDFVWTRGKISIGIEVKSSSHWKSEFGRTLKSLHQEKIYKSVYGIYLGQDVLKDGPLSVYPFYDFVKALEKGAILPR